MDKKKRKINNSNRKKALKVVAIMLVFILAITTFTSNEAIAAPTGPDNLEAPYAYVVIDALTGKVVLGSNYKVNTYPASTTKLLTASVLLDRMKKKNISLDSVVTIKSNVLSQVNYSLEGYGLRAGQRFTLRALLHMMLIGSYGDAVYCAVDYVFDSIPQCVDAMNAKAKSWGLKNSHYDNIVGLDLGSGYYGTYTTPLDIAKITRNAVEMKVIAAIVRKTEYLVIDADGIPQRTIRTTNKLMAYYPSNMYTVIGAKTGTTSNAGYILSSVATDSDGHKVICVYIEKKNHMVRFTDSKIMLDYVFQHTNSLGLSVPKLRIPKLKGVRNIKSGIKLRWDKVKNAQKYRVYRRTVRGHWKKIGDVNSTYFVDKKVKKRATYYYTVRCVTNSGRQYQSGYNKKGLMIRRK